MSWIQAHHIKFYNPEPYAVVSMVVHDTRKLLALARSDSSVEIWNLNDNVFIERRIAPSTSNNSIEQLCWYNDRLFSVGLHGFLVEYDIKELQIKHKVAVTGEAAFCLDINKNNSQLAVGTEQGYLNIFSLDEEISFENFLDKQEGKILCLKYFPNGRYIASGSIDTIRVWNVESGQAIHRMTTGRSERNKPTIVWCLQVTSDSVIISGDSRGKITFWDGKEGSQIESYRSHKADVLAMCLSRNEKTLYCAGTDPNIVSYERIKLRNNAQKWVKSIQRLVHDHDVKCLALCGNHLYSSGIDGYLILTYHPPKIKRTFPPILPSYCVNISKEARFVLLQYSTFLELWKLGTASDPAESDKTFNSNNGARKILELFRSARDVDGKDYKEGIVCCAVSSNGEWIAYSTDSALRIFHFSYESEQPSVIPLHRLSKQQPPCLKLTFTSDSCCIVLACRNNTLKVINLTTSAYQIIDTSSVLEDTVAFLTVSPSNEYLVAADTQSNISIWRNINSWEYYCKLPRYKSAPTALAVNPHQPLLVISYADQKVIEYNLEYKRMTKFTKILMKMIRNSVKNKWTIFRNVVFDPNRPNKIILHDDTTIVICDKERPTSEEPDPKVPKLDVNVGLENGNGCPKAEIKNKYEYLVHLDWLAGEELVAVEVRPLDIMKQLPPCLRQSSFGTK